MLISFFFKNTTGVKGLEVGKRPCITPGNLNSYLYYHVSRCLYPASGGRKVCTTDFEFTISAQIGGVFQKEKGERYWLQKFDVTVFKNAVFVG